jgi:hypothetical protein
MGKKNINNFFQSKILSVATLEKREAERQMIEPCVELANTMSVIGFKGNIKDMMTLQGLSEYSFTE